MRPHRLVRIVIAAVVLGGVALAWAFDGSAPASRTGAPAMGGKAAESACNSCHNDFALNTAGKVEIIGAPSYFTPGGVYTFSVRVTSSQTAGSAYPLVWGFELTAVKASDGTGAGTFANVPGEGTRIVNGSGSFATRQYVEVGTNNQTGTASPVSWQVQWTAPTAGTGTVRFCASGMAADGDGTNGGDWVYTGWASAFDITPTRVTTWGWIKQRFH